MPLYKDNEAERLARIEELLTKARVAGPKRPVDCLLPSDFDFRHDNFLDVAWRPLLTMRK